jgi:hypothetical protein
MVSYPEQDPRASHLGEKRIMRTNSFTQRPHPQQAATNVNTSGSYFPKAPTRSHVTYSKQAVTIRADVRDASTPQTGYLATLPAELQLKIFSHLVPVSSACLGLTCHALFNIHKQYDDSCGPVHLQSAVVTNGRIFQLHQLLVDWVGPNFVFGAPFKTCFITNERFEQFKEQKKPMPRKQYGERPVNWLDFLAYQEKGSGTMGMITEGAVGGGKNKRKAETELSRHSEGDGE